ncbi:flavodoxin [Actinoplanes rectilineatus]|uniref:flavodoxin n=1 Tax=Actinoplanes rectilineatus TaxID=113571 RepID=UPI001B80963C|nr:flavodoxin [Actinoplanes rectilineatus]
MTPHPRRTLLRAALFGAAGTASGTVLSACTTFTEGLDFAGKTIHPLTTYAMSGLGNTERDYASSCPTAELGEGLAVRGEEVADAQPAVEAWLRRIGLLPR